MAIREISVQDLAEQLAAEGSRPLLVDVREVDEYESGHVPGARLIVLADVADNVDAFRSDGPTYVICKSGGRSMRACEYLDAQGVDVVNVAGGTMAWMMNGNAVTEGGSPNGPGTE